MAETEPVLVINDLDAYYGKAHVVQQASLTMAHECVALMGRNGVGKTALARAIMGLATPQTFGTVRLHGRDILGLAPWRISQLGIGYVAQGRRLFDSLTVTEHLKLTARPARPNATAQAWGIERIFTLFPELAARQGAYVNQLSGGERSMLAIGRALMTQPICLILDEPTEGLAPAVVERVAHNLVQLTEQGVAILLIEQSLLPVQIAAHRVYLMHAGSIVSQADPRSLAADRQALDRFLGLALSKSQDTEGAAGC